jgi:ABC-2 type transport system ATP-binding protein
VSSSEFAVTVNGLTKRFGDRTVIDDVMLQVPRGCAFGYLGPNGAGKTTLIRTLLGHTAATSGTMTLLGLPVPERRPEALARIGAIVDEPRFHGMLSGRENLRVLAAAREPEAHARIDPALERVGLEPRADDPVSKYSMGMRQRLGVAACLLGDPELMILDEPMNGLDPAGMLEFRTMIRSFIDEGRTVVLSSHLLDEVERTCDAVAIVDRGRVVVQGPIDSITAGAIPRIEIGCSDTARARAVVGADARASADPDGGRSDLADDRFTFELPPGVEAEPFASDLNRRLVTAGIAVHHLELSRPTLEDRFLEITSSLGASA